MTGPGYNKIVELMNDSYVIADEGILKLLCATVLANRLPKSPVWLMVVAGSGTGKTEFLMALRKIRGYIPISELTVNTFISGMKSKEKETSLLATVNRGDIMVFKDFTTLLSVHKDVRNALMGQLRDIYDGYVTKRFGNGLSISFEPKLGFIGASTTALFTSKRSYAAMGERFVIYCFKQPERHASGMKTLENSELNMDKKREDIAEAFRFYLDEELQIPDLLPKIDMGFKRKLMLLADIATRASTVVERDQYGSKKDIEYVHDLVGPGRFCGQLMALATSFCIMNGGELEELDKNILYKIGMDSIDPNRRKLMLLLTQYTTAVTANLATKLSLPTDTVRRWCEDLNALEIVDRLKSPGHGDHWTLKEEFRSILSEFAEIPMLTTELTGLEDVPPPTEQDLKNAVDILGGEIVDESPPTQEEFPI